MKELIRPTVIVLLFLSVCAQAAPAPKSQEQILSKFARPMQKSELLHLRKRVLSMGGKAVPSLIEVMKHSKYPDKNRWIATFLLGKIMGTKAGPFIVKFLEHPNWVLRMASLKTLLALKENRFGHQYARSLKDNSLIVRHQALENIRHLKLVKHAPQVWAMLYDKRNYYDNKKTKAKKRTSIIKDVVRTVGDLKFAKAQKPLLSMIQKPRYVDIYPDMEYALEKITGKQSPKSGLKTKRNFWNKVALSYKTF